MFILNCLFWLSDKCRINACVAWDACTSFIISFEVSRKSEIDMYLLMYGYVNLCKCSIK